MKTPQNTWVNIYFLIKCIGSAYYLYKNSFKRKDTLKIFLKLLDLKVVSVCFSLILLLLCTYYWCCHLSDWYFNHFWYLFMFSWLSTFSQSCDIEKKSRRNKTETLLPTNTYPIEVMVSRIYMSFFLPKLNSLFQCVFIQSNEQESRTRWFNWYALKERWNHFMLYLFAKWKSMARIFIRNCVMKWIFPHENCQFNIIFTEKE